MKINKVRLTQFKRFTDLQIDLGESPKKVVALVGPNGSGKSSVFDAFEEKQKTYKNANYNPSSSFFSKLLHLIQGNNQTYDRNNAVKIVKSDGTENFDKKSFYIRTSYRFTPRLNVTEIKQQRDALDDAGRPGSSTELDGRMLENYERMIGTAWDEFWNEDGNGKTGKVTREELTGKINEILGKILDVKISNLGNVVKGRGQLYFEKGDSKDFPYENLSAGEKEVVDIITDLIIKTREYDDTVFCIDEPELHLNTAIQRKLLIEIEKLVPNNCQLWIATHSIGFLRALQEELKDKTSVLDFSENNFDETVTIVPMRPTRRNWQKIFQTALEDITGLLAPRRIVYCEGKKEPDGNGDEQGLDAEVFNTIFEGSHHDTLFISSGGNTELDRNASIALTILSKAFVDVELLILKDRDINRDGSLTTPEQRLAWLAKDDNRRMLKRREIENYLFDFEIVSRKYPSVVVDEYNKIVSNIENADVKSKTGEIMNFCGIANGITGEDFKKELATFITSETNAYRDLKGVIFSQK
jgi:predicted ATPase